MKNDLVPMSSMQEAVSYLDVQRGYLLSKKSVQPIDYKNSPLSLIDLQVFSPPTLREVVDAYLNSDEFRQYACSKGKIEVTSTIKMHDPNDFNPDSRKILVISRPREIYLDPSDELTWKFEYDNDKASILDDVDDLCYHNYVLEFDGVTGYPIKTGTRKEAMEIFGNEIMRFRGRITDRDAWNHGTERIVKVNFPYERKKELSIDEPPGYSQDTPVIDAADGYLEQASRRNFVRRCKRSEPITEVQYRFLLEQKALLQEQQRKIEESLKMIGE